MAKFPRQVKVGGTVFRVIKSRALDKQATWGIINTKTKTIRISPSSPVATTLLHEIVHAVDDTMEIGISEEDTDRIARFLAAFVVDNRPLLKWLMEVLG